MRYEYDRVEPQVERAALDREGQEGVKGVRVSYIRVAAILLTCSL